MEKKIHQKFFLIFQIMLLFFYIRNQEVTRKDLNSTMMAHLFLNSFRQYVKIVGIFSKWVVCELSAAYTPREKSLAVIWKIGWRGWSARSHVMDTKDPKINFYSYKKWQLRKIVLPVVAVQAKQGVNCLWPSWRQVVNKCFVRPGLCLNYDTSVSKVYYFLLISQYLADFHGTLVKLREICSANNDGNVHFTDIDSQKHLYFR